MENEQDPTRDFLLDLNGMSITFKNHTVTFKIVAVAPSKERPHGLDYCLVLLNKRRQRIFGIDNAHGINFSKKKFGGRKIIWDHQHREMKIIPYSFVSPEKLLEDFWNEVNKIIEVT